MVCALTKANALSAGVAALTPGFPRCRCAPCRAVAPVFAALCARHSHLLFARLDVDEMEEESPMPVDVQAIKESLAQPAERTDGGDPNDASPGRRSTSSRKGSRPGSKQVWEQTRLFMGLMPGAADI